MSDGLYRRMRAVACRYWALPPPVLDEYLESGRITLRDMFDLCELLAHDLSIGMNLMQYLSPESVERVEKEKVEVRQKQQFSQVLAALKPKNEEEANFLSQLKDQMKADAVSK